MFVVHLSTDEALWTDLEVPFLLLLCQIPCSHIWMCVFFCAWVALLDLYRLVPFCLMTDSFLLRSSCLASLFLFCLLPLAFVLLLSLWLPFSDWAFFVVMFSFFHGLFFFSGAWPVGPIIFLGLFFRVVHGLFWAKNELLLWLVALWTLFHLLWALLLIFRSKICLVGRHLLVQICLWPFPFSESFLLDSPVIYFPSRFFSFPFPPAC